MFCLIMSPESTEPRTTKRSYGIVSPNRPFLELFVADFYN